VTNLIFLGIDQYGYLKTSPLKKSPQYACGATHLSGYPIEEADNNVSWLCTTLL